MRDLLDDHDRLSADGRVGRAVVTRVWGSAPRQAGACLLATSAGRMAGSISGGCVEGAAVEEIASAIREGTVKLVSYGVSDDEAWTVGLACGGTIDVFVEPAVRPEILDAARSDRTIVMATVIASDHLPVGAAWLVDEAGETTGPLPAVNDANGASASRLEGIEDQVRIAAGEALRLESSSVLELAIGTHVARVFLEVLAAPPTLVVFGAVHIATALVPLAKHLGYRTIVADGRSAFVTKERFPEADRIIHAWPAEAFDQIQLDRRSYVCVLSHDPKFDEPAIGLALSSPAPYVGAIGSRKTQRDRRQRLRDAGIDEATLDRLFGPIGLDLGGRDPREIALAIMAQITAVRFGGNAASPA